MSDDLRICPVCGAGLPGSSSSDDEGVSECLLKLLKRKEVRIGASAVIVVLILVFIASVVMALVEDAKLEQAAESAASDVRLVNGEASGQNVSMGASALNTEGSWMFATPDQMLLVRNAEDERWVVEAFSETNEQRMPVMEGVGTLKTAAMVERDLYYSLDENGSASTLRRQTIDGSFTDFASAANVVEVAAATGLVVTKSAAGKLGWLNPETGIWHDLQANLDAVSGKNATRVVEVGVWENHAVVTTREGQIISLDVNSGQGDVLSP